MKYIGIYITELIHIYEYNVIVWQLKFFANKDHKKIIQMKMWIIIINLGSKNSDPWNRVGFNLRLTK